MEDIFKNKTVLITGGTGFIGRQLVREILKYGPKSIRILSRDELKHHNLKQMFKTEVVKSLVGDVRDYERLKKATKGCDIVIHAAALKRIDLIEYNVEECIKTNVIGTTNVVNACLENNVDKALYVSTDKACLPVNTYGATKFLSERIFIESNYSKGSHKTSFVCVRYGNVLNSTGSLLPMVKESIAKGEEISLTDESMTRFFITPHQAVELIFNALKYGSGGEVFIPKLDSFKILDVLNVVKEAYNHDKPIRRTGIRPGEKIHELMVSHAEAPRTFDADKFFVITSEIEKYQEEIKYPYLKNFPLVKYTEYNSKDCVTSPKELKARLIDLDLLPTISKDESKIVGHLAEQSS